MLLFLLSLVDSFGVSVTSVGLLIACGRLWSALNFLLKLMSERETLYVGRFILEE